MRFGSGHWLAVSPRRITNSPSDATTSTLRHGGAVRTLLGSPVARTVKLAGAGLWVTLSAKEGTWMIRSTTSWSAWL